VTRLVGFSWTTLARVGLLGRAERVGVPSRVSKPG
jgi:hypothetical protein